MPLALSIIVPVFNVDAYLEKCVNSLLHQDLPSDSYEIILVDDGSTDNSGYLCEKFASLNNCVSVIHQQNKGLGAARNIGIAMAHGVYVQFVDSDDYLEPNVLGELVKKMEDEQLDVLRFNYQNVDEEYIVFEPNHFSKPFVDYRDEICSGSVFLNERLGYGCYACQFIIQRTLLEGCFFKEGVYFEDTEWTPRILIRAQRVSSTSCMVYNYLCRRGSITTGKDISHRTKILEDRFRLIDSLKAQMTFLEDNRWHKGMIAQTAIALIGDISHLDKKTRHHQLRELRNKDLFPLSTYHATKTAGRKILLANFSPALLCNFLRFKRNIK